MAVDQQDGTPEVLAKLGVSRLPALLVLSATNQTVTSMEVDQGDVLAFLKAVRDHSAKSALRDSSNFRRVSTYPESTTERVGVEQDQSELIRRRYSVFLSDIEKTVVFALQNEVAVQEEINKPALLQFLDVLLLFFPRQSTLLPHLAELKTQVTLTSADQISRTILDLTSPLTPSVGWVGCEGSSPQYGGYPCGLWQLWHSLTLGQLETGQGRQPGLVLGAMVAYVTNFFSCRECAEHFLEMTRNGSAVEDQVTVDTEHLAKCPC